MLRLRRVGDDEAALQWALNGFQFWSNIRGLFRALAFVASVWSLASVTRPDEQWLG